ncbi:FAD:protein FMN transferase [Neolewinella agarilytica]|uniref:FAD:protein FMN transferase n=1 Tax=Neolewinella agarilytica TaxID=478744 RepID=UPI0023541007|nr:FAD:protein FMN transferase [Neolewinella agarilytica]
MRYLTWPRPWHLLTPYLALVLIWEAGLLCAQPQYTFTHPAMGTEFRITISAKDTSGLSFAVRQCFAKVDALEQSMSDYRSGSELNKLTGQTDWQKVSPDLYTVLCFSKQLARHSKGAYDPTAGPLTKLWRRAFRQQELPEEEDIFAARTQVQWKDLKTARKGWLRLRRSDIKLDLGGVAKGYALDVVGQLLQEAGFTAFLLDGGGDLLLGDCPPDQPDGWVIDFPGSQQKRSLKNIAVATSGDTYRFLEHAGRRYSHLIDPRTGYGVTHQAIITVIGPNAMIADGLASAMSISAGKWARRYSSYEVLVTAQK